jgi:hypothetical protein
MRIVIQERGRISEDVGAIARMLEHAATAPGVDVPAESVDMEPMFDYLRSTRRALELRAKPGARSAEQRAASLLLRLFGDSGDLELQQRADRVLSALRQPMPAERVERVLAALVHAQSGSPTALRQLLPKLEKNFALQSLPAARKPLDLKVIAILVVSAAEPPAAR